MEESIQGHLTPESEDRSWSARWALPEIDAQLTIADYESLYCIEIVNYETGLVLAHIDLFKDTEAT